MARGLYYQLVSPPSLVPEFPFVRWQMLFRDPGGVENALKGAEFREHEPSTCR
jgi:hypothetical protein